jgi:hypothetical protein
LTRMTMSSPSRVMVVLVSLLMCEYPFRVVMLIVYGLISYDKQYVLATKHARRRPDRTASSTVSAGNFGCIWNSYDRTIGSSVSAGILLIRASVSNAADGKSGSNKGESSDDSLHDVYVFLCCWVC